MCMQVNITLHFPPLTFLFCHSSRKIQCSVKCDWLRFSIAFAVNKFQIVLELRWLRWFWLRWLILRSKESIADRSFSLCNKKIYLRTHSDLHVNLSNLQIDPGRQTLVGHWSLHGIAIKIKSNLKTIFKYYTIRHIYNTLRSHKTYSSFLWIICGRTISKEAGNAKYIDDFSILWPCYLTNQSVNHE